MKKEDITVVIVNDFDYVQGGASKVALDTAEILYENNYNVIFFSSTHKENNYSFKQITTNQKECLKDGIKGSIRCISNRKVKKEFSELLKTLDNKKTIIHVHGYTKSLSSVIFKVSKKMGFQVVLTIHDYFTICPNGGLFNYKKCTICKKKPLSPSCIFTNCDSRNYFFKIYRIIRQFVQNKNLKNANIHYIYISDFSKKIIDNIKIKYKDYKRIDNPLDVNKEKFNNSSKNKYFAYLGRVSKEKGVDLFCEAIKEANLNGLVIGDGSELERLKIKYPNIVFTGWKNKSEINMLLKDVKVLVFPSLWYETMGLSALEALSVGIPVIVGDKCATSDYIINNKNGLIFKSGNKEDLVKKLKECDDEKISKLSENAYKYYWKNPFDKKKYYEELTKYYKQILKDSELNG